MYGAVKRIRRKIMTVGTTLFGLVPILFSQGIGADVMKRIAAPMVGGIITSAILELILYPVICLILKKKEMGGGKISDCRLQIADLREIRKIDMRFQIGDFKPI